MKNKIILSVVIFFIAVFSSCDLDLAPYDSLTVENLTQSEQGIESLANGCLMMLKENLSYSQGQEPDVRDRYVRHLYQLTEFPSDNLLIVKSTTDNLWYSFNMQHIPGQLNTTYLWFIGYKIILNANNIIETVEVTDATSDRVKHLLGEAYYYRAMVHFDLARIFSNHEQITLERFIILNKIERIKELIDQDEFSLSEIAFMMDYSSVQYLSTQFKKYAGMTVSEYKESDRSSKKPIDRLY